MTNQPLTHHEILGLVEPFARRGRHVDMTATNRLERRLVFRPIERTEDIRGGDGRIYAADFREILQLEPAAPDQYRLTRVLTLAGGLEARLEADGPDPAALLERVESVAPDRQFSGGAGYSLALSHRLEAYAGSASPSGPAAPGALTLTRGVARIADLMLELAAPTPLGIRTDVRLTRPPGDPLDLPDDVLAVLGREWAPLDSAADGWKTTLRLPGREPARSLGAERLLERGARHLARVLAESPRRFHEQFVFARWRVTLRRAVPVLVCVALIAAAASVPRLHLSESSGLRMLIFNSPPLLMMLFFCMREIPRIELPPLPRASTAAEWRARPGGDTAAVKPA